MIYDVWCDAGGARVAQSECVLASVIAKLLGDAREAWPDLQVPEAEFIAALVRSCEGTDPLVTLETLRAPDLYLACACARGDRRALETFDALAHPGVEAAMRRHLTSSSLREDLVQTLRERLLVGTAERAPRILEYRGRGRLDQWIRVAATRLAVDVVRGRGRLEDPTEDATLYERVAACEPVEAAYLRGKYGADFKQAFEVAAHSLCPRDARLLREHFVHGLSMTKMAQLHGTSKSTVARWVGAARDRLIADLHVRLAERLELGARDFESVMRLVRSELHLSLARVFADRS